MKKSIVFLIILALMVPVMASPAFAAIKSTTGIVDAGNKLCPVSGDPVSGKDFVVYHWTRYGLCCPMCQKTFLANPEKYLAELAVKEKALAEKGKSLPGKKTVAAARQGMHNM